ncbi:MAG: hypothetical protein R3C19_23905 [Planctomycetaceae bacterium]
MKLEVRTGVQERSAKRIAFVKSAIEDVLSHTLDRIDGMTVSLAPQHRRAGDEIDCRISAHVTGRGTVVAATRSGSVYEAVNDALRKLARGLAHTRGKRFARRRGSLRTLEPNLPE